MLLFLDRFVGLSLLIVVIKHFQRMEINEDSLFCHPQSLILGLPLTMVPAASPSEVHSIWGLGEFVPCLSWLWHGVGTRKICSTFSLLLPINSDHHYTWCTSAPGLSHHTCMRQGDDKGDDKRFRTGPAALGELLNL